MASGAEEEEEDQRREAALASTSLFQPGFKSSRATQAQIDKLKELHKRRLKIKEESKRKTKAKGNASGSVKACGKISSVVESEIVLGDVSIEESNQSSAIENACLELSPPSTSRNGRKLRWGLDTKERWERKSNM